MNIDELKYYDNLTEQIEDQCEIIFQIALEEYPEQFGNFIKDNSHLESFEIQGETIHISFGETVGDWNDTYSFTLHLEDFLNLNNFRKIQQVNKKEYLEGIKKRELKEKREKEARELARFKELKKKYE